ncbi:MAG: hypothetical protein L3J16_04350, partial [Anaerolineales bacterium]|nr:hypothetical protein [Anaerolineales bacterium]
MKHLPIRSLSTSIQGRLLKWAALFLGLQAMILTFAPRVHERTPNADLRWGQWAGLIVWLVLAGAAHIATQRYLPESDPYLLPIAALFSGWGLLTIWELSFTFGMRQTVWLAICAVILVVGMRWKNLLPTLRRYKYLWLTSGLFLTALTLIFGSNPSGAGARLWLGFGSFYLPPS